MDALWWSLGIIGSLILIILITSLVCFFKVFFIKSRKEKKADEYNIPEGRIYEVYRDDLVGWMKMARTLPYEKVEIKSRDGLTLRAKYYECEKDAPVELLFHGYKGDAERDLSGGIERCFALKRNVLLIDQRAGGASDGHVTTFGVKEREDCVLWAEYAAKRFGNSIKLFLSGVSMGAATVMMASAEKLPESVVCILADCGYDSQKNIISKILREMHLPTFIFYPMIKLGAKLYGGFNLDETTPLEAMKSCHLPIIFVHGDADKFVPHEMSVNLYNACVSEKKRLVTIKDAGHGLAFPADRKGYIEAVGKAAEDWGLLSEKII